ncbi:hypothetical protein [Paraburkholderia ultramafica]|uniref:hypothetical protein n=1 Tax=Paraburkholderia ultramafica TaxID=1544867 RepID=UPI00158160E9
MNNSLSNGAGLSKLTVTVPSDARPSERAAETAYEHSAGIRSLLASNRLPRRNVNGAMRFVTPAQRHGNLDQDILDRRAELYENARRRNPLRWKGHTRNWQRVDTVHLNPDRIDNQGSAPQHRNQDREPA